MELITKLSGLLKAITYTIRVICRVNFKTVKMYENSIVQFVIVNHTGRDAVKSEGSTPQKKSVILHLIVIFKYLMI